MGLVDSHGLTRVQMSLWHAWPQLDELRGTTSNRPKTLQKFWEGKALLKKVPLEV